MINIRSLFIAVAIALAANTSAYAQVYVREKPVVPKYEKVNSPGPHHVWIEEEWEPKDKNYVFVGCRWMAPPKDKTVWIPGHWAEKKKGWVWIPGHWTDRA